MGISPQDCSCSTDNGSNPAEGISGLWELSDHHGLNQESGFSFTALDRIMEVLTSEEAGRGGKVIFPPPFQPLAETPLK